MLRYGKLTQNAIAAMSCLAEVYDGGNTRLSSAEVARARRLPQTLVAKLLTRLSQANLVHGSPGPRGGYALAKAPAKVSLYDVAIIFERPGAQLNCPFGPDWCGTGEHCPLHDKLERLSDDMIRFLKTTTFQTFADHPMTARPPIKTGRVIRARKKQN